MTWFASLFSSKSSLQGRRKVLSSTQEAFSLPSPVSCTRWPFYQRFVPRHTRPRICCDSLLYIPTTVKWNTIWLCPYGVRSSYAFITFLLTIKSLTRTPSRFHGPHPCYPSTTRRSPLYLNTLLSSRPGPVFGAGSLSNIPSWVTPSTTASSHKTSQI
jgi:hypothetical protein